jgi:MscS family membrane protein
VMQVARLFCVVSLLLANAASGQSPAAPAVAVRPADLSSPRDTLQGFLADADTVVESMFAGTLDQGALRRAAEAMDFSATPDAGGWGDRIRRILMLREVLRRVGVPPLDAIPGDADTVAGDVVRWIHPGVDIVIARAAAGERTGVFLFAPETVRRVDRLYRLSRSMPFQIGSDVDAYAAIFASDGLREASDAKAERRLGAPDAASPLAALEQFLQAMNRSYSLARSAREAEGLSDDERARRAEAAADWMERAVATLDLSAVPHGAREGVGVESALRLKEVLDRIALPPLDAIPDAQAVALARSGAGLTRWRGTDPLRWRHPGAAIDIVEVTDGERHGDFLFSSATVRKIGALYERVAELPYRRTTGGPIEDEYRAPEITPGFLEMYVARVNLFAPKSSLLGRVVARAPESLRTLYAGQPLWKWIALAIAALVGAVAAAGLFAATRRVRTQIAEPWSSWLALVPPFGLALITIGVGWASEEAVNLTGAAQGLAIWTTTAVVVALTAWGVFLLCCAAAETMASRPALRVDPTSTTILRIGARILGFVLVVAIVVAGLRLLGADVVPLIAGLGVGGLAVALAAQRTFANLIGSVILFLNKPIRVGDLARYGENVGTVESIGLLSTRIRSLSRTIVTVPNAELSEMKLENFSARDEFLLSTTLQLRYETSPEQMRYVIARLREVLIAHPKVSPEPARVRFSSFGAYSKDVDVFAYLRARDWSDFCAIREDVLFRFDEVVAEAGTGFAFPSQTAYLARDQGLDTDAGATAEERVGAWRASDKLPFPEFDEAERERLEDSLAYPPQGSPHHRCAQRK